MARIFISKASISILEREQQEGETITQTNHRVLQEFKNLKYCEIRQ